MRPRTKLAAGFALAALIALAAPAAAHELTGPAYVVADGEGHFAYELVLVIENPVEFGFAEEDGTDNTDIGHWIADGFCLTVIDPGTSAIPVEGNLLDATQSGTVIHTEFLCDGFLGVVTTTILPPGVATAPLTWGTLKARYR